MSRIYLIVLFTWMTGNLLAQNFYNDFVEFADSQKKNGDYISAIFYYEKALSVDDSDPKVRWNYAESLRMYREYRKAEEVYEQMTQNKQSRDFPEAYFYLGQMQKNNGKYPEAIKSFKEAKKKFVSEKRGYYYLKSRQEIASCLWAKKAMLDSLDIKLNALGAFVNTEDSEFGHSIRNKQLFFSSLKADSSNQKNDEVYASHYRNALYRVPMEKEKAQVLLNAPKQHLGNGSFSLDGKRFYFSSCRQDEGEMSCKILVALYKNNELTSIDTLGEIINDEDASNTMPSISLFQGKETLFFSSERLDGSGGLDIYYSHIKDGNQYAKPIAVRTVNTIDQELSPFYDSELQRLYFSSSWFYGFGGYDIYYSEFSDGQFKDPVNAGLPINSSANDLYYFRHGDSAYLSTNRIGVQYTNNPTCCSDVFAFQLPDEELKQIHEKTGGDSLLVDNAENSDPPSPYKSLEEMNRKLPVTLYFHNDIPNPRSRDTTTKVNYINSYKDYVGMIPKYKHEYSRGLSGDKKTDAEEDIESFFIEYVQQGVKDLEIFQKLVLKELEKGRSLILTVKGFASPLAKTDYNVNLTKRRIASLVNYLSQYGKGEFRPYLENRAPNGARLTIQQVPFGEYKAAKLTSDNPQDLKNSIYSRSASLERKIEVQSVSFMKADSNNYLITPKQLIDLGTIRPDQKYTRTFEIENSSKKVLEIDHVEVPCHCSTAELEKKVLQPGEKTKVSMTFDPKGYEGKVVKSIYVHVKGAKDPLRLVLTGQVVAE
ncbi:MAG: DUF1573 domain-containing protein [Bacteroidetes bacterium]|nr:MAG: DUF1573 domain-containing protein [Bacteroidota bacterium]